MELGVSPLGPGKIIIQYTIYNILRGEERQKSSYAYVFSEILSQYQATAIDRIVKHEPFRKSDIECISDIPFFK